MVDCLGRLIYVGKSKALRNRLLSYFLPGNEEDKSGRIVQSTARIVWETQPSEFAALLREQSLIRQFQPRFNVQGIPRRQQTVYVCLGRGPAEQLYVARRYDPSATFILGPLAGAGRANRAVEVLNRIYQLRDCSTKQACSFADQLQLFEIELRPGCLRLEIGTCLGPCIAACSRQAYGQQAERARDFLAGRDVSALQSLTDSMHQAAKRLQFEQALQIRQDLLDVQWLSYRAADIALARDKYSFIYPIANQSGRSDRQVWYLIRNGMIEGALAAPQGQDQWPGVQKAVRQWWLNPDLMGSTFVSRPETLALVAGWFRKNRQELKRTFQPRADGNLPSRLSSSKSGVTLSR
jgi:excinuclease ABC subunit C